MIELNEIKTYVCQNHDGEIVFTYCDADKLRDEIHDLNYQITEYRLDKSILLLENMQLKKGIEERDEEIAELEEKLENIKLKNNQKNFHLIDEIIQTIYETDREVYDKLVEVVEFGKEIIK